MPSPLPSPAGTGATVIPDSICFIDIETLPEEAHVGMDTDAPPGWDDPGWQYETPKPRKVPGNYRDFAKIQAWEVSENERHSRACRDALLAAEESRKAARADAWSKWAKGSLSGMRGRVACIAVAFGESDVAVIECAEKEEAGLERLDAALVEQRTQCRQPLTFVAHYGIGFDFPFIQLRAMKCQRLGLARKFHQAKPWDGLLVDTKDLWPKVGGYRAKGGRLADCCAHLGINHDDDNPITGAEVLDAYIAGRWGAVVAHAAADVRDLREVYRVLAQVRGL